LNCKTLTLARSAQASEAREKMYCRPALAHPRRSMASSHHHQVELLEQGFGLHRTKLGSGEKEVAYAIKQSRLRAFAVGVCATLVFLTTLTGVFMGLYDGERVKNLFSTRQQHAKLADEKGDAMKLAFALHHQEAEQDEQQRDSVRMLNRITSKIEHTFEERFQFITQPDMKAQVLAAKKELVEYVQHELKDFKAEISELDKDAHKRLEMLAAMQEQSMRDLLTTVSGVKLEELDSMLDKVFRSAESAPEIEMQERQIDDLENLADAIMSEIVSLEEGKGKFEKARGGIKGSIPPEIESRLRSPIDADDFGEGINELCEFARLSYGRGQIMTIRKQYRDAKADGAQQEDEQGEIRATVEAVIQLHKLVSQGKVPFHLLDLEVLDLKNDTPSGDAEEAEQQDAVDNEDKKANARQQQQQQQQQQDDDDNNEEADDAGGDDGAAPDAA
jgi:hypothetical protein